jgi:hypothetical protein
MTTAPRPHAPCACRFGRGDNGRRVWEKNPPARRRPPMSLTMLAQISGKRQKLLSAILLGALAPGPGPWRHGCAAAGKSPPPRDSAGFASASSARRPPMSPASSRSERSVRRSRGPRGRIRGLRGRPDDAERERRLFHAKASMPRFKRRTSAAALRHARGRRTAKLTPSQCVTTGPDPGGALLTSRQEVPQDWTSPGFRKAQAASTSQKPRTLLSGAARRLP